MSNGKLEGRITVPAGGWDVELTDGSGTEIITVPAGTYYHSGALGLAATIETLANVVLAGAWNVSLSSAESGSGRYTISATGAAVAVDWLSADLRDLMGYTGDLSGSTSYLSPSQARALWLPSYGHQITNKGGWRGSWETDTQVRESSRGDVYAVAGQKKRVVNSLVWPMESAAKTWEVNETLANESFERFYLDNVFGEAAWGTATGPIRYYPDADTSDFGTYSVVGLANWQATQLRENWTGLWAISIGRMVEVPG